MITQEQESHWAKICQLFEAAIDQDGREFRKTMEEVVKAMKSWQPAEHQFKTTKTELLAEAYRMAALGDDEIRREKVGFAGSCLMFRFALAAAAV